MNRREANSGPDAFIAPKLPHISAHESSGSDRGFHRESRPWGRPLERAVVILNKQGHRRASESESRSQAQLGGDCGLEPVARVSMSQAEGMFPQWAVSRFKRIARSLQPISRRDGPAAELCDRVWSCQG